MVCKVELLKKVPDHKVLDKEEADVGNKYTNTNRGLRKGIYTNKFKGRWSLICELRKMTNKHCYQAFLRPQTQASNGLVHPVQEEARCGAMYIYNAEDTAPVHANKPITWDLGLNKLAVHPDSIPCENLKSLADLNFRVSWDFRLHGHVK